MSSCFISEVTITALKFKNRRVRVALTRDALFNAPMSANPHKTDSAPSNQPGYVETDPFFNWAEEAWIIPCQAKLPKPLHGLCMYGPAFAVMLTLILTVALLAWCEERGKKKAPPVEEKKPDKKKKASKKTD